MVFQWEVDLIQQVNSLANQHRVLDSLFLRATRLALVKMFVPVAMLWYLWFRGEDVRRTIVDGLSGAVLAMIVSRLIQNFAPHRPRPAVSGEFQFTLPAGAMRLDWSSFPSDTAALGFALAAAIFAASRLLGWVAVAWVTVFACLPRLYGGYHYPSDLIAGAFIGWLCVQLASAPSALRDRLRAGALDLERRDAAAFYVLAFAFGYLLLTFFDDVRVLGELAVVAARAALN